MGFWLIAALLTLAAILAVLLPLARRKQAFLPAEKNDLEVYRDQLREVEADAARGMIDPQSAEQARIEISRRILNAEKSGKEAAEAASRAAPGRLLAFIAVLAVPLIAWGIYPLFGKPDMPSMPLAERLSASADRGSVDELVARAEAHLAQNPGDVLGWDVLAPIYLRLGRATDAVNAYRSSIRIAGENFPRVLGLGEALATASGGTVTAEAEGFSRKLPISNQMMCVRSSILHRAKCRMVGWIWPPIASRRSSTRHPPMRRGAVRSNRLSPGFVTLLPVATSNRKGLQQTMSMPLRRSARRTGRR